MNQQEEQYIYFVSCIENMYVEEKRLEALLPVNS